jgi:hypothetical protein
METIRRLICLLGMLAGSRWHVAAVGLFSATYLYVNLFTLHGTPYLLSGDQVYFWTGAQQILDGQILYRDFFQYTTPGADLVFAAFFRTFGASIWVTNLVVLVLGVVTACVGFSVSRKLMRAEMAAICTALFLVLIYGKALNATHHWFAALLILIAAGVCMDDLDAKRIAVSGALLGFAAFFNQAHGGAALIGFTAFLLLRGARAGRPRMEAARMLAVLVSSFLLVLAASMAYYVATAGFDRVWYCLVTDVFEYAGKYSSRSVGLPYVASTSRDLAKAMPYLAVYVLLPIVYGFSLWRCWRFRRASLFPWDRIMLLALVGFPLLLEVGVSVNWLRLFGVSFPGTILAVWILDDLPAFRRFLVPVASLVIGYVAIHQVTAKRAALSVYGEAPGGRFAASPQVSEKISWLAQHTQEGETFFQAGWPGVYVPLKVRNPIYFPTVTRPDGVRDQDVAAIIQQMKANRIPYVFWTHTLDENCEFARCNDYLLGLRAYLISSYVRMRTFEDGDVLWMRSDDYVGRY